MRIDCDECNFQIDVDRFPFYCRCGIAYGDDGFRSSKGAGDKIAAATSAVGIKPCGGCKKRQKKMNQMFPNKQIQADVLIFVPTSNVEAYYRKNGKLADLIEPLGMTTNIVPVDDFSMTFLNDLVDTVKPSIVINQCMLVPPGEWTVLIENRPNIKFLTVNHSSFSDMFRVTNWLRYHEKHVDLAQRNVNAFYAHVDDRRFLERLYTTRTFWLPNPIVIPAAAEITPPNDPMQVSLVCRADVLKNIPNQLLGLALASDFKVAISNHRDRERVLAPLIRSLGLEVENAPWGTFSEYESRIKQCDIGLQCSFTESMNFVCLEHLLLGKPVVGSHSIRYLPSTWQACADDPDEIANTLCRFREKYTKHQERARTIGLEFASVNNEQFVKQFQQWVL